MFAAIQFDPVNATPAVIAVGLMTWLVKYMMSWLTAMVDAQRKEQEVARVSAATASQVARDTYAKEMAATRESYKASLDQIMQHCLDESKENKRFHIEDREAVLAHIQRIARAGYVQVPGQAQVPMREVERAADELRQRQQQENNGD